VSDEEDSAADSGKPNQGDSSARSPSDLLDESPPKSKSSTKKIDKNKKSSDRKTPKLQPLVIAIFKKNLIKLEDKSTQDKTNLTT